MTKPAKSQVKFAKDLMGLFGGQWSVAKYKDEAERSSVEILTCRAAPAPELTTHATLDLHNYPNSVGSRGKNIPVNLIWMCKSSQHLDAKPLSTAAFCIINSHWSCAPGIVFPDVIKMYLLSHTMQHVFFVPPIPWDKKLGKVKIGQRNVHCLSMIPISEAEYRYAEENGGDALEELLAGAEVDFADIERDSVI